MHKHMHCEIMYDREQTSTLFLGATKRNDTKKHGMATWQPKQIYANSSSNIDSEIIKQAKSI